MRYFVLAAFAADLITFWIGISWFKMIELNPFAWWFYTTFGIIGLGILKMSIAGYVIFVAEHSQIGFRRFLYAFAGGITLVGAITNVLAVI